MSTAFGHSVLVCLDFCCMYCTQVGVSNGDVEVLDAGKEYTRLGHLKGSALSSLTAMDVGTSGVIAVCGKSGDVGVSLSVLHSVPKCLPYFKNYVKRKYTSICAPT